MVLNYFGIIEDNYLRDILCQWEKESAGGMKVVCLLDLALLLSLKMIEFCFSHAIGIKIEGSRI